MIDNSSYFDNPLNFFPLSLSAFFTTLLYAALYGDQRFYFVS